MRQRIRLRGWSVLFLSLLLSTKFAVAAEGFGAVTMPSKDVLLSFTQPGLIAAVNVAPGDRVQEGQNLVQQDSGIERVQLSLMEAQSRDTSQILASEASLAQKRVDLEKLQRAAARDAATELEVEHAKLNVRIAELSLQIAKLEHAQNQMKCKEARIRVARMALRSPIAGIVERVDVEAGESVNALADVVRVVRTAPLWIDVPVPLATGQQLTSGQKATIEFPDTPPAILEGRVVFVAAVADAASGTLRVRVETSNKAGRPAGEHVRVRFPAEQ